MRTRQSPVESLLTLPRVTDPTERRARWRQAIASLGQDVRVDGPPKTDGLGPEQLVLASRAALDSGLVDDLDWIDPASAAVALYELSASLPAGRERREIGRRVFERLYEGTAGTFAAVATRMALGTGRSLEAPTMRARASLLFHLPVGCAVNSDPLALMLIMRQELFERWVARPAGGALSNRRLAAKLLERAAREAVRRALQGDPYPAALLVGKRVRSTFESLLNDREPLVWRHAAVARGVLAASVPELREEIDLALDPMLTPTEWRRGAVSLVPCLLDDYDATLTQCTTLIEGELARKDPGIAATLLWGLPPVMETEPEGAESLLRIVARLGRHDIAESMSALLGDTANPQFGADAARQLRQRVLRDSADGNSAMQAMLDETLRGLDPKNAQNGVHGAVRRALLAFESKGARAAYEHALEAADRAQTTMEAIEALSTAGESAWSEVVGPLADLDASALETSRLYDLLLLGKRPGDTSASVPEMERLYAQLTEWVLKGDEIRASGISSDRTMVRQRKLRTLLHLVDLDTPGKADDEAHGPRVRYRTLEAVRRLLGTNPGADPATHRLCCATLARSFDAAVREGFADPSDVILLILRSEHDRSSVCMMAEASTHGDVQEALRSYAEFLAREYPDAEIEESAAELGDLSQSVPPLDEARTARSFIKLSNGIATNGSYRGEALRQVVLRIGLSLQTVALAGGLSELAGTADGAEAPISELERQLDVFRRLLDGSHRRLVGRESSSIRVSADVPTLSALVERAISGVPANAKQFESSLAELAAEMPTPFGAALRSVLAKVSRLPIEAPSDISAIPLQNRRGELPNWLLPRRTIGGFYVVRALGAGGGSSVFVARRIEERHDPNSELYALKVPLYDPNTARSVNEQEFFQMFRDEAGALLSLPQHRNLARFVTFDAAARPKPILVMELIRGVSLDRALRSRALTCAQVLRHLDGILSGLEAMHSAGVGHLDVKPTNVILRDSKTPVLVDFGLSGRQLRPGCGTLEYCAPEVLGAISVAQNASPCAADLYSFGCTAYELLTGDLLFDAEDELALMSLHIKHDGWPEKLRLLAESADYRDLCAVLGACIRHNPHDRITASKARRTLARASRNLTGCAWPLQPMKTPEHLSA